jgi:hypothetical protein
MTVNKANNYTQPTKRKQIFNRIKAAQLKVQLLENGLQEKHKH